MLSRLLDRITAPNRAAGRAVQDRLDSLTKPPGSLGRLEELVRCLAEISGACPPPVAHPAIFTLAGDHGVATAGGVSAYPQIVTAQMVENFLRGGAAVNALARHAGARVIVADLGVATPLAAHPDLRVMKIAAGTRDMTLGPAMSRAQAIAAIEQGIALVESEMGRGLDVIGTGDM